MNANIHPWPSPATRTPIALWAFIGQREAAYLAYAQLLIADNDLAADTVNLALAELSTAWDSQVMAASNPPAAAWDIVRRRILAHADPLRRTAAPRPPLPTAHNLDPDTDIVLLAGYLGMDEKQISDLTGQSLPDTARRLYKMQAPAPDRAGRPDPNTPAAAAFTANWHTPFLGYTLSWCGDAQHAEHMVLEADAAILHRWRALLKHAAPAAPAFRLLQQTVRASLANCQPHHAPLDSSLAQALADLTRRSPQEAECLRLRHLVRLDYPRTAALLGISPAAARQSTWNALRFLDVLSATQAPTPEQGSQP